RKLYLIKCTYTFLVSVKYILKRDEAPKVVERVNVAVDGHGHGDDMRAFLCSRWNQRLVGKSHVEIADDRQALNEPQPVDFEHRHQALRVQRAIIAALLLVIAQIDLAAFIIDALEIERDANAVGRGRTERVVEERAG